MKNKSKEMEINEVESRSLKVQKGRVTREIYGKVVIWVG